MIISPYTPRGSIVFGREGRKSRRKVSACVGGGNAMKRRLLVKGRREGLGK